MIGKFRFEIGFSERAPKISFLIDFLGYGIDLSLDTVPVGKRSSAFICYQQL